MIDHECNDFLLRWELGGQNMISLFEPMKIFFQFTNLSSLHGIFKTKNKIHISFFFRNFIWNKFFYIKLL